MGDVVDFPARRFGTSDNMTCPECGGEWWKAPGIVVDASGHVTGYGLPLLCLQCDETA